MGGIKCNFFRKPNTSGLDLNELELTKVYGVFKSSLHNINYAFVIKVASTEYYVFYDDLGFVSSTSKVSLTTSPTSTTLNDLITANPGIAMNCESIFGTTGIDPLMRINVSGTDSNARLVNPTTGLELKNSKACLQFTALYSSRMAVADTIMESGNDFTVTAVLVNGLGRAVCSALASNLDNFNIDCANTRIARLNNGTTNFQVNYTSSQSGNTNQRVITVVVDGTAQTMKGYLDGVLQETVIWSGSYLGGTDIVLGSWVNAAQAFNGKWQFLGIAPTKYDDAKALLIYNKLNSIFNF